MGIKISLISEAMIQPADFAQAICEMEPEQIASLFLVIGREYKTFPQEKKDSIAQALSPEHGSIRKYWLKDLVMGITHFEFLEARLKNA
jgi:hypothetical protein